MDARTDTARLIRCTACHAVYAEIDGVHGDDGRVGCPECGETVWIAVDIPLPGSPEQPSAYSR